MIRTIMKSVREYKAPAIWTPILIIGEVAMECMLPFVIAKLINEIQAGCEFEVIVKYGVILAVMAVISLIFGVAAGKPVRWLPADLRKTCARICSIRCRAFPLRISTAFPPRPLLPV